MKPLPQQIISTLGPLVGYQRFQKDFKILSPDKLDQTTTGKSKLFKINLILFWSIPLSKENKLDVCVIKNWYKQTQTRGPNAKPLNYWNFCSNSAL